MKEQEKLNATVLKLYSAGTKVADIVTQTGVPRSMVYCWIKNEIWRGDLPSQISKAARRPETSPRAPNSQSCARLSTVA